MREHVAAKKTLLKAVHKMARYTWAKEHKGWVEENWYHIIWTDGLCGG
jgi:hypothetical protein